MKYRLAGSLTLLACCLFGFENSAPAQEFPGGGVAMPAYSPAWSMPPGSIPPGSVPPGMMYGGGMAQQAAYQDYGGEYAGGYEEGGYASMPAVDQAHPDGGYAPADCGCNDGACYGSTPAGLLRRGLLKGRCASGACGMGGGPFAGGGDGWGGGGLLGNSLGFRWMRFLLPEDDGGECAVRWFDVAVDFMYLNRDDTGTDRVFSRRGGNGPGDPAALGTNQLDFDFEPGFRFLANI